MKYEINQIKKKLKENEAKKYSGGLILSMKLATIATQEQTLATLHIKSIYLLNMDWHQLTMIINYNNNSQINTNTKENIKSDNENNLCSRRNQAHLGLRLTYKKTLNQ